MILQELLNPQVNIWRLRIKRDFFVYGKIARPASRLTLGYTHEGHLSCEIRTRHACARK